MHLISLLVYYEIIYSGETTDKGFYKYEGGEIL